MIKHERVAENIYSFKSEAYAQVTAGVVAGPNWAIVIDTLAFPEEALGIRDFVEQELSVPVRYVINTHYHADHAWGNCFFPGALIISSALCRTLLEERGIPAMEEARRQSPHIFQQAEIVLPHLTFETGKLGLQVGKKRLSLVDLPGSSPDGIGVLIEDDKILFAGDILMPIPYIVDGDIEEMRASLRRIADIPLENVVRGHGDIILRGEVIGTIERDLKYLDDIEKAVKKAGRRKYPLDLLESLDVEQFDRSRIALGGLIEQLHQRNMAVLFERTFDKELIGSEYDDD